MTKSKRNDFKELLELLEFINIALLLLSILIIELENLSVFRIKSIEINK